MIGRVIEGSRPAITFIPAAGRSPRLGLRRINAFRMGAADLAGQGGLSRVFEEAGRCGTPVAVKVGQPFSDGGIAALENEAAVLAELRHPHIIDFLGQGTLPDGLPFVAMEYFDREALLFKRIESPPGLSCREALFVVRGAASALAYLHSWGLVHADLKPNNVFYDRRTQPATVKLFDFGLARPRGEWLAIERSA